MTMFNYESDDVYKQVRGETSPQSSVYYSEVIKDVINEASPNYPKLSDYEKEWLHFYKYVYEPGIPVDLEYVRLENVTKGVFYNSIPYEYKRAILKGQTLINMVTLDTKKEYILEQDGSSIKMADVNLFYGFEDAVYTIIFEISNLNIVNPNSEWVVYLYTMSEDGNADNTSIKSLIKNGRMSFAYSPNRKQKTEKWLKICLHTDSGVGSTITIKNVMVLKGDHTQKDIPYFEGMQSVKMPVLTTSTEKAPTFHVIKIEDYFSTQHYLKNNKEVIIKTKLLSLTNCVIMNAGDYAFSISYDADNKTITVYNFNFDNGAVSEIINNVDLSKETNFNIHLKQTRITIAIDGVIVVENLNLSHANNQGDELRYYEVIKELMVFEEIEGISIEKSISGIKTIILTVNEDVTLRSNGDVYDELNLLTGLLTQRIDENNEVLAQEVVRTVELSGRPKPMEGTTYLESNALLDFECPVESTGAQTLHDITSQED